MAKYWQFCLSFAVLMLVTCESAPLSPSATSVKKDEWGPIVNGVKTRLVPSNEKYVLGQPMEFRLEMTNVGESTVKYDSQQVKVNNSMLIRGPDGKIALYVDMYHQTIGGPRPLKLGETVTLFDRYNVEEDYYIAKPGRYTVQFRGEEGFGDVEIPQSNVVEIELEPGEISASYAVVGRILDVLPNSEGWQSRRWTKTGEWELFWHRYSTDFTPQGRNRSKCTRIDLVRSATYKDDLVVVGVWVTEVAVNAEEGFGGIISEYLGASRWGHVYVLAPSEAEEHWTDVRQKISQALGIKPDKK